MTTKKLLRQQTCWAEFLSGFNFVISSTPSRENRKADLLICQLNDCSANDHNDQQQHLLQTTLISERLQISFIDLDKSETILEKVIQVNLANHYCIKLRKIISTYFLIESINTHHLSNLSIDTRDCIHQLNRLWVPDHLPLIVIREVHNQIVIGHPGYQKTVSLIT